jgi:hypothetical protein
MPGTVSVACKLPNGIFIHADILEDFDEPVMGGGYRTTKRAVKKGEPILIYGNVAPHGEVPKAPIVAGYAVTHNVDADVWFAWLKSNEHSPIVKNKVIFAYEKPDMLNGAAKEHQAVKSGLERIDPVNPPQVGRMKIVKGER